MRMREGGRGKAAGRKPVPHHRRKQRITRREDRLTRLPIDPLETYFASPDSPFPGFVLLKGPRRVPREPIKD